MVKYEIGDVVKIVFPDATYSAYKEKFVELNFKNKEQNLSFSKGTICTIFNIAKHDNCDTVIYALKAKDRECLVIEKAFILVKKKNPIFELW